MSDLVAVYYTSNRLDAKRPHFAKAVRDQLLKSLDGEFPIVCVSHEPLAFGDQNIVVGPVERSHTQIYRNVLHGAVAAASAFATAPYIALCEDDALYSWGHFRSHRPPLNKFAYDFNKWGINTWMDPPVFGYRARMVINHLIAPRELLIESLTERFEKFKDVPESEIPIQWWGDLGRLEHNLGVTTRKWEPFAAPEPGLVYNHEEAFGFLNLGKKKSVGGARCDYLHPWGSAQTMLDLWNEGYEPKSM